MFTPGSDTKLLIILLQFDKQCNYVWSSTSMQGILLQTSLEIPFSKNCYLPIKKTHYIEDHIGVSII